MRKWSDQQLTTSVKKSGSVRQVLNKLHLVEAGGNYDQVKKRIQDLNLDTSHFHGKGWRKGLVQPTVQPLEISLVLVKKSYYQSFKLKKRLIKEGFKKQSCEMCGWAKMSSDGRIPLELDHINGDKHDNRLENLQILCPNCHSLQPTHRGRNKKRVVRN